MTTLEREERSMEERQKERIFGAEIRRVDSEINNIKKSADRQEDRFTRALEKIDQRFEKLEATLEAKFEKVDRDIRDIRTDAYSNFKWLIGTYIAFSSMILAAFYAFATYLKP